jgi:hypothetical protein
MKLWVCKCGKPARVSFNRANGREYICDECLIKQVDEIDPETAKEIRQIQAGTVEPAERQAE